MAIAETKWEYINDLVTGTPNGATDPVSEGDDQLAGLKDVLTTQFPNLGQAAVNGTAEDLNSFTPVGGIIMFSGTLTSLPANWNLCDGSNGTVDLTNQFIYGAASQGEIGSTGGSADSVVVNHTHTFSDTSTTGPGSTSSFNADIGSIPVMRADGSTHTHDISGTTSNASGGVSGAGDNIPPYMKLAYIQRIA